MSETKSGFEKTLSVVVATITIVGVSLLALYLIFIFGVSYC